jgi:hypothetical protein
MTLHVMLAAFATYRITRFITADALFEPVRERLETLCESREWHRLTYLLSCDWCLSIWVAPLPASVIMFWPNNRALILGLIILTLSAFTGLASTVERSLEA